MITSIISLGRRKTKELANTGLDADNTELKSIVIPYSGRDNYSDEAKSEHSGAHACIWTVGVTPGKLNSTLREPAVKGRRNYTAYGLRTAAEVSDKTKPFHFLYP